MVFKDKLNRSLRKAILHFLYSTDHRITDMEDMVKDITPDMLDEGLIEEDENNYYIPTKEALDEFPEAFVEEDEDTEEESEDGEDETTNSDDIIDY